MAAKDLRTETAVEDRSNDVKTSYLRNGSAFNYAERNKSYQDISSSPLSKVEVQTTRPCAVVGPDRILLQPSFSNNLQAIKSQEYWNLENGRGHPPDYPVRPSDYQDPSRNISPRLTYQENMLRVMVPNQYGGGKPSEEISMSIDKSNPSMQMHVKAQVPGDNKFCDVPYSQNCNLSDHRVLKSSEASVSNVNPSMSRNVPHVWPSGVNARPPLSYTGTELYSYPEFANNSTSRGLPVIRPHRSRHDEPVPMYGDPFYRPPNYRYEPYSIPKERYLQSRYEYINYSNSYPPPHYPPPKYDLQKFPYHYGYQQMPYKIRDSQVDNYHRQPFPPKTHNLAYPNNELHPSYTSLSGTCLQNKYQYSAEGNINSPKATYDLNNKQFLSPKPYPENYYLNELQRQQIKGPMINSNYMHAGPPYPYYRKDNMSYKHNEISISQMKNPESVYGNHLHRIPPQFSPNIISSNDYGMSQEDCGYVSQSSTTSVHSTDSIYNMFRMYDSKYGYMNRNQQCYKGGAGIHSGNKQKRDIDVRQFLQMWNESEDEANEFNGNKEAIAEQIQKDSINSQDQLYVLGLVNVPSEELGKYEHIQKVSKLPENIKGYTNLELLSQFEEAIGSTNIAQPEQKSSNESKISIETTHPLTISTGPLSPLDVEAKISQSVIHKEVGCNFEIKPCSPQMFMAEVTPASSLLDERSIEKINNPHNLKLSCHKDSNKNQLNSIQPQERIINSKHSILSSSASCEMAKNSFSPGLDINPVKANYSYQDLESSSGICLASLPRIDSDIELSFPEVNQQFINANKPDAGLSLDGQNDKPKTKKTNANAVSNTTENNFGDSSLFANNLDINTDIRNKPMQSVRTNSVIIKNPENSNEKLENNLKTEENSHYLNEFVQNTSSTPIDLVLTSKSCHKSVENFGNKNDYHFSKSNLSIDEAINLSLNPIDTLYEEEFNSTNRSKKHEWENSVFQEGPMSDATNNLLNSQNSCSSVESTDRNLFSKNDTAQNIAPSILTQKIDTKPLELEKNEFLIQDISENQTKILNKNNALISQSNDKTHYQTNKQDFDKGKLLTGNNNLECSSHVNSHSLMCNLSPKDNVQNHYTIKEDIMSKRQINSKNNDALLKAENENSVLPGPNNQAIIKPLDYVSDTNNSKDCIEIISIEKNKELLKSPENVVEMVTDNSEPNKICKENVDFQKVHFDVLNKGSIEILGAKLKNDLWHVLDTTQCENITHSQNQVSNFIEGTETTSVNNHETMIKPKKSYNFFKKHYSTMYQNFLLLDPINSKEKHLKIIPTINKVTNHSEIKDELSKSTFCSADESHTKKLLIKTDLDMVNESICSDVSAQWNERNNNGKNNFIPFMESNKFYDNINSETKKTTNELININKLQNNDEILTCASDTKITPASQNLNSRLELTDISISNDETNNDIPSIILDQTINKVTNTTCDTNLSKSTVPFVLKLSHTVLDSNKTSVLIKPGKTESSELNFFSCPTIESDEKIDKDVKSSVTNLPNDNNKFEKTNVCNLVSKPLLESSDATQSLTTLNPMNTSNKDIGSLEFEKSITSTNCKIKDSLFNIATTGHSAKSDESLKCSYDNKFTKLPKKQIKKVKSKIKAHKLKKVKLPHRKEKSKDVLPNKNIPPKSSVVVQKLSVDIDNIPINSHIYEVEEIASLTEISKSSNIKENSRPVEEQSTSEPVRSENNDFTKIKPTDTCKNNNLSQISTTTSIETTFCEKSKPVEIQLKNDYISIKQTVQSFPHHADSLVEVSKYSLPVIVNYSDSDDDSNHVDSAEIGANTTETEPTSSEKKMPGCLSETDLNEISSRHATAICNSKQTDFLNFVNGDNDDDYNNLRIHKENQIDASIIDESAVNKNFLQTGYTLNINKGVTKGNAENTEKDVNSKRSSLILDEDTVDNIENVNSISTSLNKDISAGLSLHKHDVNVNYSILTKSENSNDKLDTPTNLDSLAKETLKGEKNDEIILIKTESSDHVSDLPINFEFSPQDTMTRNGFDEVNVICSSITSEYNETVVNDDDQQSSKDSSVFIRTSLKRSLSDSAICNDRAYSNYICSENKSSLWPHKRKKIYDHSNDGEIIFESYSNLMSTTRRNSLSPSNYNGQVSFCILIDNDLILSQESQNSQTTMCLNNEQKNILNDIVANTQISINIDDNQEMVSEKCLDAAFLDFTSNINVLTNEEEWVDDVACVETVVTDDVIEDDEEDTVKCNNIVENNSYEFKYNEDISNDNLCLVIDSDANETQSVEEYHNLGEANKTPLNSFDSDQATNTQIRGNDIGLAVHSQHKSLRQSLDSLDKVSCTDLSIDSGDNKNEISTSNLSSTTSPEVSSTTPEDKKSNIRLKITNLNGSITSQTNFEFSDRKIRCKFTEKNDYLSTTGNLSEPRPLITKAAQKYIPPLKIPDFKVSLRLPKHILNKLKFSKVRPQNNEINFKGTLHGKYLPLKKTKPNFEDVLMNIDKANVELQKDKFKKVKKNVPKVIIKKNRNGSHYTTPAEKHFNPDLTGKKWQPWVILEKSKFIDKMAIKGKTKAIYCYRNNTYILYEKKYKYKSAGIASANFVISRLKTDHNKYKNPLKYTIRLKS